MGGKKLGGERLEKSSSFPMVAKKQERKDWFLEQDMLMGHKLKYYLLHSTMCFLTYKVSAKTDHVKISLLYILKASLFFV